jgi:hypothetical protein
MSLRSSRAFTLELVTEFSPLSEAWRSVQRAMY